MYSQRPDIILQSPILAADVKGGMAGIAAKTSQDYQTLKEAFNGHFTNNNHDWSRIFTVLRARQDAVKALAIHLEHQKLKREGTRLNTE